MLIKSERFVADKINIVIIERKELGTCFGIWDLIAQN